jgi:hypothetical protein
MRASGAPPHAGRPDSHRPLTDRSPGRVGPGGRPGHAPAGTEASAIGRGRSRRRPAGRAPRRGRSRTDAGSGFSAPPDAISRRHRLHGTRIVTGGAPGGMNGRPGVGPSAISRCRAAVSRWSAFRSPRASNRALRNAMTSVSSATTKLRPQTSATWVRNARRNASLSSAPGQVVPPDRTRPAAVQERSTPGSTSTGPWWTTYAVVTGMP